MANRDGEGEKDDDKVVVKKSAKDFKFIGLIGEGSFSMVALAVNIQTRIKYAIKICEKRLIIKENKTKAIMREKQIMNKLDTNPSPYFVKLYFTFQDHYRLFFGLSFAKGGELSQYIHKLSGFNEECTIFYSAQILVALEHLHKLGIIHRDLKPENILLNEKFHIQITDFGSAYVGTIDSIKPVSGEVNNKKTESLSNGENIRDKQDSQSDEASRSTRSNSFVGTAQYVSPEMLRQKRSYNSSDLWAYGCIVYQMLFSSPPFNEATDYLIFQRILTLDLSFPRELSPTIIGFIKAFLVLDPYSRLGASDDFSKGTYPTIRSDCFFDSIRENFDRLYTLESPLIKELSEQDLNLDARIPCLDYDSIKPGLDEGLLLGLVVADASKKNDDKVSPNNLPTQEDNSTSPDNMLKGSALSFSASKKARPKKKKGIFLKIFKH
ncbi:putative 3-phosphoinositide-dependent protein kinase 2 [Brevipalpus obovatus]|uniref:putative 3-phosphoinositide-dependent protein kinase 2 n=1 Tax=Brevipalpus obovatus TaxID=246614 RepID=UPI003D9EA412